MKTSIHVSIRTACAVLVFAFLSPSADAGFSEEILAGLTGVSNCAAAWGDYDNDGRLDIALAGQLATGARASRIYRNLGGGVFQDIAAGLPGVDLGSLAWGDYDNDGDLDLALAGYTDSAWGTAAIYRNDGGTFTNINAPVMALFESALAWGDYDNDGRLDLIITGRSGYG